MSRNTAKELSNVVKEFYSLVKLIPSDLRHSIDTYYLSDSNSKHQYTSIDLIDDLLSSMAYYQEKLVYYRKELEEKKKAFIDSFEDS